MAMRTKGPIPAPTYFVLGAVAQYLGAAVAVLLFVRVHPVGVTLIRSGGAALLLWAWRRPQPRSYSRPVLFQAVIFGLIITAMNLCFYLGAAVLPLGNAVAIEFLGPIAVAVAGCRTSRNLAALLLALIGVGLLADLELEANPGGIGWALGAAVLWAGYIVYGKRVADTEGGGLDSLTIGLAVATLVLAPFALPSVARSTGVVVVLVAGLGVALLSSVIPYALDQLVLPRLSQGHFAFLLALLPATALGVGALVLGQLPSWREVFAVGLVVFAVAVRSDG